MMSRKHYRAIAEIMRKASIKIVKELADYFEQDNFIDFDREKFLDACGVG